WDLSARPDFDLPVLKPCRRVLRLQWRVWQKRKLILRFDDFGSCLESRLGVAFFRSLSATCGFLRGFRCQPLDVGHVARGAFGSSRAVIPLDLQNFVASVVRLPPVVGNDCNSARPCYAAAWAAGAALSCRGRRWRFDNKNVLNARRL